ncbi:MAG: hypothetical protein H0V74_01190 [Chloroflexi bacterium]|nr:hypothetical protein [Chloroflexota bacterium]
MFALIFFGALVVATLTGAIAVDLIGIIQPAAAATVILAGFVWRPAPGLLAFAVFVLLYDTTAFYVGDDVKRVDELVIPALLIFGAVRLQPWRTRRLHSVRDGSLVALVVLGVISSLANEVPVSIWIPALALLLKPIVILYVASWLPMRTATFVSAARVILAIGVATAVLGIVEAFDQRAFQQALGLPEWVRPRGSLPSVKSLFAHPAIFAWFMAFLGLYCLVAYVELRHRWLLALGALFGVATFLTARRRAIGAAAVALLATFAWSTRRIGRLPTEFRRWVPVLFTTLVIAVVFVPGLLGLYDRTIERYLPPESPPTSGEQPIPEQVDDEGAQTSPARVALYTGSFRIARDHFPLGAGVGRYGSHMSRIEYSPIYHEYGLDRIRGLRERNPRYITDTFWPMILGEFGVGGLAAYGLLLVSICLAIWRAGRSAADATTHAFMAGTLAVLVEALIESLATPMFTSPPRSYLLFAAIGSALALTHSRTPTRPPVAPPGPLGSDGHHRS